MLTQDAKEVEHRLAQSYALFHVVIGFLQCLQGYLFEVELPHCPDIYQKIRGKLNLVISPHDLRRYSATYASRNRVPLEILSKVILRHQDLKTTQVYLGKVSDQETIRWIDILRGK
jgi:integrase